MSKFFFRADRTTGSFRKADPLLIVSILLLWGLGIFTLFICTPDRAMRLFNQKYYFVVRQLIWSAAGFAVLLLVAFLPMNVIHRLVKIFVLASIALCFLTFVPGIGDSRNGASRWIRFGSHVSFQPSEAAKLAVVLFLANYFAREQHENEEEKRSFLYPLGGLFLFLTLIILQKDFSTAVLLFVVGVTMFFVTGAKMKWLGPLMILAVPAAFLLVFSETYRIKRIISFVKPDENMLDYAYQQMKSEEAISSGGIFGNGLGSDLSVINSIPEIQTDYIFSAWASAMGLIGVIAYFALLVFFAWRCYRIALTTQDVFAAYGTFGCATLIILQSLINVAVVCGAIPTTGIPLPFFSSGGSSLVITMAMCGFMLNASCCDSGEDYYRNDTNYKKEDKTESFDGVVVEYE